LINFIAELGINHQGNTSVAMTLIQRANDAGASAVKFQYRNLSNIYAGSSREIGDELVGANIRSNFLLPSSIEELTREAQKLGLKVGISFFSVLDIGDFPKNLFDFYKVPSSEMQNFELVHGLIELGQEVLVSSGMHTEKEISNFADTFGSSSRVVLMHCVSNYPVAIHNANLRYISHLKENYPFRVGYSSHDEDWENVLLAVALEPDVIERHITLDKDLPGLDHNSSSTPSEFAKLVKLTRGYELDLSSNKSRVLNQGEKINRQNLGRSLYAKRSVSASTAVTRSDFELLSPQVGMTEEDFRQLSESTVLQPVARGEVLSHHHFRHKPSDFTGEELAWFDTNHIGIPARLHDYKKVIESLPVSSTELHLSFGELGYLNHFTRGSSVRRFSVHAPDYISPTNLLNPFSEATEIRDLSVEALRTIGDFASLLHIEEDPPVVIVCSFSDASLSRPEFYSRVRELFTELDSSQVKFSLQWLPPFAWYFGGTVRLDRVNQFRDLGFLIEHKLPVTLDLSHLQMGHNFFGFDPIDVMNGLKDLIVHIHASGAEGVDGEGVDFDFFDPVFTNLVGTSIDFARENNVMLILESWQGHLENYQGFRKGLKAMHRRFGGG